MAEFQKVMREWKRMCKSRGNIPDDFVGAESALLFAFDRPEEIERLVMEWAEENHEPVYPTWAEWLNSTGLTKHEIGQFCVRMPNQYSYEVKEVDTLNEVAYKPIPADIAQKLGIEPKEG